MTDMMTRVSVVSVKRLKSCGILQEGALQSINADLQTFYLYLLLLNSENIFLKGHVLSLSFHTI